MCAKVANRKKLVRFDFNIYDGSNVRYMQRVISGTVMYVEADQSSEESVDEKLRGDVDVMAVVHDIVSLVGDDGRKIC